MFEPISTLDNLRLKRLYSRLAYLLKATPQPAPQTQGKPSTDPLLSEATALVGEF